MSKEKRDSLVVKEEVKEPDIQAFVQGSSNEVVKHNAALLEHYLPTWLPQARMNTPKINTLMAKGGHNAMEIPIEKDVETIFLVGSGPSLDWHLPSLKKRQDHHLIICTNSNYSDLVANGVYPDIVMATDSSDEIGEHLWYIMRKNRERSNLVTTVTVHPSVIEAFYPNVYLFKSFFQDGDGGVKTPYNHFINNLFDNITNFLTQAGCVTNQAIIFIDALKKEKRIDKTQQVVLLGCDYSYTADLYRCMRYKEEKDGSFTPLTPLSLQEEEEFVKDRRPLIKHQGVLTNPQMLRYKRSLYTIWTYLNLPLFRIGPSILNAVPEISWETFDKGTKAIHKQADPKKIKKQVNSFFKLIAEHNDEEKKG